MSESLQDITINSTEFISLNAESGITIGDAFWIQNKGFYPFYLIESATQPTDNSNGGVLVSNKYHPTSTIQISTGSLNSWARVVNNGKSTTIYPEVV